MKVERESIFMSALRSFFIAFFAVFGILISLAVLTVGFLSLYSLADSDTSTAQVKFLPDAEGKRKDLGSSTPVILQVSIDGTIGAGELTGKKMESLLLQSREDKFKEDRVKGILLVINSPGGGVVDSDIIYRHLRDYKERYGVPVFAFIDGICASGGYYISLAADKIYASNVSLIGSIGVKSWPPFVNVTDAFEKMGISSETLSAGKGKDEMNPFRPWKEGEQLGYQKLINYYYDQFVQLVASNRPSIDEEMLVGTYGAEVFPAPVATEHGFIDDSGKERRDVLTELVSTAGIEGKYQVIGFEAGSWWQKAFTEKFPITLHHRIAASSEALFEYR